MTILALAAVLYAPPAPGEAVPTLDLAKLDALKARSLDGRPVREAFVIDSLPEERGDCVAVEAAGLALFHPGDELERVVTRGVATFLEVGKALLEIRDQGLWKGSHASFDAYCRSKKEWPFGRARIYQLLRAGEVAGRVSTAVDGPAPVSERQTRALAPLPEEVQPRVWQAAVEAAGGEQPTGAAVQELARKALASLPAQLQREVIAGEEKRVLERGGARRQAEALEERLRRVDRAREHVRKARKQVQHLAGARPALRALDAVLARLDAL